MSTDTVLAIDSLQQSFNPIPTGQTDPPLSRALHLQQCLNMLQGDTKPIRRLVEARFDEIKVWGTRDEVKKEICCCQ